jgi:hypothetical protein
MNRSSSRRRRAAARIAVTLAGAAVAVGTAALPATAADGDEARWSVTVDGRDPAGATADTAVPLRPGAGAAVRLSVENPGPAPLEVRALRLEGRVLGLTFFSFVSEVPMTVPAGGRSERNLRIGLEDLRGQATGLVPARLTLLGPGRRSLGTTEFVADVRGSVNSAYGVFGLVVAALTAMFLAGLALEIARLQLPANRWRRATRFLAAGAGVGLTLTFTSSALRVLSPGAGTWVPLVLTCAGIAFVLGYVTPRHEASGSAAPSRGDSLDALMPPAPRTPSQDEARSTHPAE